MRKSSSSRPDRQPVLSNRPTDRTLKCLQKTIQIIITFNIFTNPNLETVEKRKNIQRLGSAFLSGVANLRTTLVSSRETSSEEDELVIGAFGVIALTTLSLRCI